MTIRMMSPLTLFGVALFLLLPFRAVQAKDDDLARQVELLQSQVAALQAQMKDVMAYAQYMSLQAVNGQPTVRFTGVNVQVVNGQGKTGTANGVGNLIVGYDEPYSGGNFSCTVGMTSGLAAQSLPVTDQVACAKAGGAWQQGFKTGSHYLVLGSGNNYSRWGGLVAGANNTVSFDYASVTGGSDNTASGSNSSVSGGDHNTARGYLSSVSGGQSNIAGGASSSVIGGKSNNALGIFSTVTGGSRNAASALNASVSGGHHNTASGAHSSVTGGIGNTASGSHSSVSGGGGGGEGGVGNTASGEGSSVSGGDSNTASGFSSSVFGGNGQDAKGPYQTLPKIK